MKHEEDEIIKEVRRVKEALAARYHYDIRAMGRALRREEKRGGRRVVTRAPKGPFRAENRCKASITAKYFWIF